MQREMMFRAWDTLHKKWVSTDFHVFGETTLFDLIGLYCYETKDEKGSLVRYNDIEVTEWAGLTDINEKLAYENDLVQWKTHEGGYIQYGVIRWNDNGFWITAPDGTRHMPTKIEVIGNTYEHPDLMEKYNIV